MQVLDRYAREHIDVRLQPRPISILGERGLPESGESRPAAG
jgi:hypothetical protein